MIRERNNQEEWDIQIPSTHAYIYSTRLCCNHTRMSRVHALNIRKNITKKGGEGRQLKNISVCMIYWIHTTVAKK